MLIPPSAGGVENRSTIRETWYQIRETPAGGVEYRKRPDVTGSGQHMEKDGTEDDFLVYGSVEHSPSGQYFVLHRRRPKAHGGGTTWCSANDRKRPHAGPTAETRPAHQPMEDESNKRKRRKATEVLSFSQHGQTLQEKDLLQRARIYYKAYQEQLRKEMRSPPQEERERESRKPEEAEGEDAQNPTSVPLKEIAPTYDDDGAPGGKWRRSASDSAVC